MHIFGRALVVCAMLLAGCGPERYAAMNRFISRGTLARQGTENGDEIPIGMARDPEASSGW